MAPRGRPAVCRRGTHWPDGSFEYRYFNGNHLLQVCYSKLTVRDLDAFRNGRVDVGLYREQNVIFFLFRIDGFMDWSDQAFSIRLVGGKDQSLPPLLAGMRIPLILVLVNADDGKVAAMRLVTYSPHFSRILHSWLRDQKDLPFFRDEHMSAVSDIYGRFRDSKALARAATLIERAGAKT